MSITKTDNKETLVRNPEKASRFIDYAGLNQSSTMNKKSVYASDIDSIMEFGGKHLIIVEIKEEGAPLRTGQRLLLERLADATKVGGFENVIVLFATHSPDLGQKIPVSECTVTKCYMGGSGQWNDLFPPKNLIEALQGIGKKYNIKKLM